MSNDIINYLELLFSELSASFYRILNRNENLERRRSYGVNHSFVLVFVNMKDEDKNKP